MKSRQKFILLILAILFISSGLWAQYSNWTQYTNGRHITAMAFEGRYIWIGTTGGLVRADSVTHQSQFFNTANSGLPSNNISAVAVDNQGNKWIGTLGKGLARYDGTSFSYYRQSIIGSDIVNALAFEVDTLWVGTNGGAARYDGTGWTRYTRPNYLPSDTVTSIAFGGGLGWIGTAEGIVSYENGDFSDQNANLPEKYITSISTVPDLRYPWIGMQNSGVAQFNITSWTIYNTSSGLPGNQIQSVAVDVNGRVLAGTPNGLGFYDGNTWVTYNTATSQIPDNNVTAVQWWNISDKANIGTLEGGLAVLSFSDNSWTGINTGNSGLSSDAVNAVSVTQDGRIWAGSSGYLAYFDGSTWATYTPSDVGIPQGSFSSMALDVSGNPWVGTSGQGLLHYTGSNWAPYSNPSTLGFPDNYIQSIAVAPNGDVWIGTYGGVGRFNGTTWTTYNTTSNPPIPDNEVRAVAVGSDGTVWISDNVSSGPVRFNGTSWTVQSGANINLIPGLSWVCHVTSAGEPWVGTPYSGAALYSGGQWLQYNAANTNIPSNNVRSIVPDKNGFLWFGTDDGLARFDRTVPIFEDIFQTHQPNLSGLTASSINAIAVGPDNEIFAATDSGLAVYSGFPFQGTPSLQIRPTSLAFGDILVGNTGTRSVVFKNTGTGDLVITELRIPTRFSILENPILPDTIAPGDSAIGHIQFSPSQAVVYLDTIQVTSNAATSPDDIIMTGTGVSTGIATLQLRPDNLAFGNVFIGSADTLSVVSKNTGTANLIISLVQYPAGFSYVGNLTYPDTLAPGDSLQGRIRFAPTQAKAYSDTIKTYTNMTTPRFDYIVTGTGVTPGIDTPNLLIRNRMFGYDTVTIGRFRTLSTHIKNTGLAALRIDSFTFIEVIQGVYTLLSPSGAFPISVPVNDSILVSIRFQPTDVVFYGGQVKIVSNSPTSPDTMYIGGSGVSSRLSFTGEEVHVHTGLYSFLSVPYVLGSSRIPTTANQITTVLKNLGPYDPDKWRLFHIKNNKYLEYPDFTPADSLFFKPGIAFWLIATDTVELNLQNVTATPATTGTGENTTVANYRITLKPKWNMIGNPFAYSIQWSSVLNTASVQAPVVYNVAYMTYSYNQPTLEPWRGYFVYNRTSGPIDIQVPPFQSIPKAGVPRVLADDEFILKLQAKGLESRLRTSGTSVGMLYTAQDGLDDEDYYEAPPIGNYVQLSAMEGKNRFAGNFKSLSSEGASWDLSLSTTGGKEKLEVTFEGLSSLPKGFSVYLLDQDRECIVSVEKGRAEVEIQESGQSRRFRLIAGTEEFAKQKSDDIPLVPYHFALKQNYPNPFNPGTYIDYSLSHKSSVKLVVYNMIGQKVRILFHGEQGAGVYQKTWDGMDDHGRAMNSGVYVCRLEAGQYAISKKMILIR